MLYQNNKYTKWYYNIINKINLENRCKGQGVYYEAHHIIPECLGGDNKKSNLVLLTAKEHFICHLLLVKMVIGQNRSKMVYALNRLNNTKGQQKHTSRMFEYYRKECSDLARGANNYFYGNTSFSGVNNQFYGKHHTKENKEYLSQLKKEIYVGNGNPFFGKTHTEKTKNLIGKKTGERTKGRLWYNDGLKCYRLYPENANSSLKEGRI